MGCQSVLWLGRVDDLRVSVGYQPLPTLMSLVTDALGVAGQGVPSAVRSAVRAACPADAAQVLRPACGGGSLWLPDCLSPLPLDRSGVRAQLDRMEALAPERLAGDLAAGFPEGVPVGWRRVADRPGPFVRAYVQVMLSVWTVFAPVWRRSRELLDLEAERIGIASVTGTLAGVFGDLSPRVGYAPGLLRLPDRSPGECELRERRLLLVPLVSGSSASVVGLGREECAWIGYPLPGLRELCAGRGRAERVRTDPLEAVLGRMRARLLRQAHRGPTMGEVSALLGCAPGAVTHHCKQLEAAGLIRRRRQGQQVRVRLTRRGQRLLGALAG
ncbi:hypothetical protein ACFWAA_18355 [Streptomyces sp. NPDC059922]|uniref:hypothetical protein n=1 Tax=Streptomyces sp. NPDC059922 TaxID=3347005 RepID=UPI0036602275